MIVRLIGIVEAVEGNGVTVRPRGQEGVWIEAQVSAATAGVLIGRAGEEVELRTITLLEQGAQGTTITPRLLGFLTDEERRLFELLTTVKGLGPRRALRAMARPVGEIARAIVDSDVRTLKTLPEIGKRLAETMVVDLREKVEALADAPAVPEGVAEVKRVEGSLTDEAAQAVEALVRLGETRQGAEERVRRVVEAEDAPIDADAILAAAFGG